MNLLTEHRHAIERVARARSAYNTAAEAARASQRVLAAADLEVEDASGELRAAQERQITAEQERNEPSDGAMTTGQRERRHDE